jgi:hypothetical protein
MIGHMRGLNITCASGYAEMNQRCHTLADEYIIFGCFQYHISETALCAQHATSWLYVQTQYKHRCQCGELIEDFIPVRIYHGW